MTQALATVFEQAILEHPEDWHMLQKVFVSDLDPERLARSRARSANGNGTRQANGADTASGSPAANGADA
jgi:KDO2-lipid IV(A) lauroyltransferase